MEYQNILKSFTDLNSASIADELKKIKKNDERLFFNDERILIFLKITFQKNISCILYLTNIAQSLRK